MSEKNDKKVTVKLTNPKLEKYMEETPLLRATMGFNTMAVLSPFAQTSAIRSGDLLYRANPYLTEGRIAEMYMLNSKSTRHQLGDLVGVNLYRSVPTLLSQSKNEERVMIPENTIKLPTPREIKLSVGNAIKQRRSIRDFAEISVPLDYISSLLYYGNGVSGEMNITGVHSEFLAPLTIKLRTAPSGGALYPVDIYLIALNVKNLEMGLYLYNPPTHSLIKTNREITLEKVKECYAISEEILKVGSASFIFVFVGKLWKTLRKYGNRGLRYIFIEAGEIGENIHLAAQGLRLGTVDVAGFYDPDLEHLLGIDGISEHILNTILGGFPKQ